MRSSIERSRLNNNKNSSPSVSSNNNSLSKFKVFQASPQKILPSITQQSSKTPSDFYSHQKKIVNLQPDRSARLRFQTNHINTIQENKWVNTHSYGKSIRKTLFVKKQEYKIEARQTLRNFNTSSQWKMKSINSRKISNNDNSQFLNRSIDKLMRTTFRNSLNPGIQQQHSNYLNKYEIIKQLGKGGYGIVYLAKRTNQEKDSQNEQFVAIKVYEKFKATKDPTKFKNIRKEINVLQNINYDGAIKMYENVETLTKINIVMQYGGSNSLLDYLKKNYPLKIDICRQIGFQLLSTLAYLHSKNIAHRDIKLQNILVSTHNTQNQNQLQQTLVTSDHEKKSIRLKLIDFGFSTITNKNRKQNAICGTPNYMAPQLMSKKLYVAEEVDIWAFGIIMYTIYEGKHPFRADNVKELQRLVNKCSFQFRKIADKDYQNFIKQALKFKGSNRPRADKLLKHPFLAKKYSY